MTTRFAFRNRFRDDFEESEHPRTEGGEFARKGTGGGSRKSTLREAPRIRADWPSHVVALRIPPAWTDVSISHDPESPLQAVGRDAKGRLQYVYSEKFQRSQSAAKFARISALADAQDAVLKRIHADQAGGDARKRDHADCLALIVETGIRPGSEVDTRAERRAHGASTLEGRHVVGDEKSGVRLQFVGKKGVDLDIPVRDAALARMLVRRRASAGRGAKLFPTVGAASLLAYTHETSGEFKTKDFRTLLGTRVAVEEVARRPAPTSVREYRRAATEVARVVATRLGNTPVVALQSYISPIVFAEWRASSGA